MKLLPVYCLLAVALSAVATEPQTEVRSYRFGEYGALEFTVPTEWQDSQKFAGPGDGVVGLGINFKSSVPKQWLILISAYWNFEKGIVRDPKDDRLSVQKIADGFIGKVRENPITVRPIAGKPELGYVFSVTDKVEKPGEYLNLTQGIAFVGEVVVPFSIFSNGDRDAMDQLGLRVIATAKHVKK